MGICMQAVSLGDEKISRLMAEPPLVWRIVEPEDLEPYLRAIGRSSSTGFFARLFGGKAQPAPVPRFAFGPGETRDVYLDKSWDGLNFCLKQLLPSRGCKNLFEDGTPVGDVEIGYGPALSLTSKEVADIAACYRGLSGKDLLAKYAPSQMRDVYLGDFWSRGDESCESYLVENFDALNAFVQQAAANRLGMLVLYA